MGMKMTIELGVDWWDRRPGEPEAAIGIMPDEWLRLWPEDEYPGNRNDCRNMHPKMLEISPEKFRQFVKEHLK